MNVGVSLFTMGEGEESTRAKVDCSAQGIGRLKDVKVLGDFKGLKGLKGLFGLWALRCFA